MTGIDFINLVEEDDSFNIIQYLYYYNGGGVSVGDVNNDGYPDIYFSANRAPNKLFLNLGENAKGQIKFQDISEQAGVEGKGNWSTGVNMVDVNADGWLDIYVCQVGNYKGFKGKNQLFINQGCRNPVQNSVNEKTPCIVSFKEEAAEYGLDYSGFSTQTAFFDYDLDGDLDMYLLCHSVHSSESYRDTTSTRMRDAKIGDKFFKNMSVENDDSRTLFLEVSEQAGVYGGIAGYGLGIAVGDIDKNGYPDIYIGNDFHENDFLYLNQGDGTFREMSDRSLNHTSYFSMGNDLSDINNDGWLDLMTLDMKPEDEVIFKQGQGPDPYDIYRFKRSFGYHHQFPQNSLQINLGADASSHVRFSENAEMMGVSSTDWSWSTLMADFNLDGWKDIYITNGIPHRPNNLDYLKFISNREIQENASDLQLSSKMPDGKVSNYAYENKEGKGFENSTDFWGLRRPSISHGAAYADFDLDGDLDIVVNNLSEEAFLFENTASTFLGNHYISIKLRGPESNPFGLGSKVSIYTANQSQYQELFVTRGWQSTVDYTINFGTGSYTIIDSIRVLWPDQRSTLVTNLKADQKIDIDYRINSPMFPKTKWQESSILFTNSSLSFPFSHQENKFFDNTREPLIPYLLSTQGPKIANADVNNDGDMDFYIGGASGQAGRLFIQTEDAQFTSGDSTPFGTHILSEETGLTFFDADGDGDQDLYIGSGGNQYVRDPEKLKDRLYLNNGYGHFTESTTSLPNIFEQTSCVEPYDFDNDGDQDLFIGIRSVALSYGRKPDNYLLINDGNAHFKIADKEQIDLSQLGMVTAAKWADIDMDGNLELLVVGDWMPVTIFRSFGGKYLKSTTGDSTLGWWNTIFTEDLDNDGDPDLILGNLGLNSNLKASVSQPVNIYISDFDANLTPDPVLTHFKQGLEFPLLGLDALGGQMVFLKKKFRSYNDFSEKSIFEILSPQQLQEAQKEKITELRSMIAINDGKGNFEFRPLPQDVQKSSVNAILTLQANTDHFIDILVAGNFYDLQPAIGRLDGSYGTLLLGTAEGSFIAARNQDINLFIDGQVRDLQMIRNGSKDLILIARNDAPIQCLEINRNK